MLEKLIEANTTALIALTAALTASRPTTDAPGPAAKQPAEPPKPTSTGALDYEKDVKPLVLRLAKEKGRDTVLGVLGEFKIAQANLLKPEQYGDFITACNKALAAPKK